MKTILLFLIAVNIYSFNDVELSNVLYDLTDKKIKLISTESTDDFLSFERTPIKNNPLDQAVRILVRDLTTLGESVVYETQYNHESNFDEITRDFFEEDSWFPEVCETFKVPLNEINNCRSTVRSLLNPFGEPISYVYINGDAGSYDFKYLYVFKTVGSELFHFRFTIQDETLRNIH